MSRPYWIVVALPCLATLLLAQPVQKADRDALRALESNIQTLLASHGERALGEDAYRWSTRLENISGCWAGLTVRVTNNVNGTTVHTHNVSFSLGALVPYGIIPQKNGLELPCAGTDECILTTSTCSRKTTEGVVIDCTTVSHKRENSLLLQLDGDAEASSRLERDFIQAINLCHKPAPVRFLIPWIWFTG